MSRRRDCFASKRSPSGSKSPIVPTLRVVPRPPRIQVTDGIYHVTSRGNRRQPIYTDDRSKERFLTLLEDVVMRMRWTVHAYCLMTNHYHLSHVGSTGGTGSPDISSNDASTTSLSFAMRTWSSSRGTSF